MNLLLGTLRLLSFVLIVGGYLLILPMVLLFVKRDRREHFILYYRGIMAKTLFVALGLQVTKKGEIPIGPCLLVSNHRSYIDPAPVTAYLPGLPLAKMEVKSWPLIGLGVKMTGIILVDRSSGGSRKKAILAMKDAWQKKKIILNYPEGTTHNLDYTLPFKKGAFMAAFDQQVPIVPMIINYGKKSDAWVGEDTFIPHFIRCFGKWKTQVYIEFGEPLSGNNGNDVMDNAKKWMDKRLKERENERHFADI